MALLWKKPSHVRLGSHVCEPVRNTLSREALACGTFSFQARDTSAKTVSLMGKDNVRRGLDGISGHVFLSLLFFAVE